MQRREFFRRTAGALCGAAIAPTVASPFTPAWKEYGLGFEITEELLEDDEDFRRRVNWLRASAQYVQERHAFQVFDDAKVIMSWKAR